MNRQLGSNFRLWFTVFVLFSVVIGGMAPNQTARAQISNNAQMNKSFTPIDILPGGTSVLRVTIFNPNTFPLTNASWTDNLQGLMPGLFVDNPPGIVNTCGGTFNPAANDTSITLTGGTVPQQVGGTPGSCYVEVNVSSVTTGNLINVIPPNELTATGATGPITNTDEARATLHVASTLSPGIAKSFTPSTIWVGQNSRLDIGITNTDLNTPLTNAGFTDNLPPGVTVVNPPAPTTTNCGGGVNVTANNNSGTITVTGATIAPSLTCVISVTVTASGSGVYQNTIPAGALTTQQGVTNLSPANATLNVQNIGVDKAFDPPAITPPGTSTLTITLQNPSGSPMTGVSLTDTLPAASQLEYVPGTAATTCAPGTVALTGTPPVTLTLTNGTIPAGSIAAPGTCTITVQVTAPVGAPPGNYTNRIPAGAVTAPGGISNVIPATAPIRIYPAGGGVTGSKNFNPPLIQSGQTSVLQINVRAPQDTGLTNVTITDNLPAGVTIVNPPAPTANANCGPAAVVTAPNLGTQVQLTNGAIPAGANCRITLTVTSSVVGVHTNTIAPADITNTEGRTVPPPGLSADLTVIDASDLSMAKNFQPGTVAVGGISQLTITLTNANTSPLVNVTATDTLPGTPGNGLVVAPVPNAITTCLPGGVVTAVPGTQTITLNNGTVPAQVGAVPGTCTIRVNVQATGFSTTYTNTIPIANVSGTIQGTPTVIHPVQPASAQLIVTPIAINIVKGFQPVLVYGGTASTLSIQLINPNNFPLSGINFVDNMPAGMIIANPPNLNTGTCGGSLTGAPLTGSFSFAGGSLPALGSCTLTLSVTMNVNGNRTNIIPIGTVTTAEGASNPDATDASLTNLPGAGIAKVFSPNPISLGDYSLLTITIQNTGSVGMTGLGLVDALPTPLTVAGPPAPLAVNNCGGSLAAAPGATSITLTGGALANGGSCTLVIPVSSISTGCFVNIIPPGGLTADGGITNPNPASDTLCVTGGTTGGLTKSLTGTSSPVTSGTDVAIGEVVTYTVGVVVPANTTMVNARLVDTMNRGLSFLACDSIDLAGVTTSDPGGASAICANPTVDSNGSADPVDIGRRVTFNFGDLTNSGQTDQTITTVYRAVVLDSQENVDGKTLDNSVSFIWSTGSLGPVSTRVRVIEPDLVIDKTSNTSFIAQGTEAIFTLTIQHTAASHTDAFDVVLEDTLPTSLDYVAGSIDCTTGAQDPAPADCTFDTTTRTIRAVWPVFTRAGGTGVVRLRVTPNASYVSNTPVTNVGVVAWTSLPGPLPPQNANPYSRERFYDPGSPIDVYGRSDSLVLNPLNRNPQARLKTGFAPGVVTDLSGLPVTTYDTDLGLSVEIPRLNIYQPVVGVAFQGGQWDVTWLTNQIGWLQKTAFPGFTGNSVLTGHLTSASGAQGPFSELYRLNSGDRVMVHAFGELYTYEVRSVKKVSVNDISLFQHEEKPWLTLVTCADYDEASGTYLSRLVVRAALIESRADRSGR